MLHKQEGVCTLRRRGRVFVLQGISKSSFWSRGLRVFSSRCMDTHCVCAGICSNTPLENLHYCVCARSQSLLYRTWWCFVFISFVCTSLPCIKTGFSIQAFQVCVFVVFRIRFYCIVEFFNPFPNTLPFTGHGTTTWMWHPATQSCAEYFCAHNTEHY